MTALVTTLVVTARAEEARAHLLEQFNALSEKYHRVTTLATTESSTHHETISGVLGNTVLVNRHVTELSCTTSKEPPHEVTCSLTYW